MERKIATVCTSLKASVYSIVLQQHVYNDGEEQQNQHQQGDVSGMGGGGDGGSMVG